MINRLRWLMARVALTVAVCVILPLCAGAQTQNLDQEFKDAAAHYEAGRFPEAAMELEKLVREVPDSFEVQELLGLVYASQSQNDKANPHLEKAVRLRPNSATARTNFGNNLVRLGKPELAEQQFKKAVALDPQDYEACHDFGELYARANRVAEALPFLERAQQIKPASYENGYDLALAYLLTGRLQEGRQLIHTLATQQDTAELHNLLGQIEEKDGNFIAAANEFQTAAHLDPSESNLFDWASELLVHRTLDPAIAVFRQGTERYPNSARMAIGLGMAYYSLGKYDDAVKALLRAADLAPSDPRSYPFLSRAFDSSPSQANDVIERFQRFTEIEPKNGRAFYYYALSLWKAKRARDPNVDLSQIESLLKKTIALDPNLAEAHQQLGNLYSDQKEYAASIPEYLKARALNPSVADVHYRLAQAYIRTGEKEQAQEELKVYQQLRAQELSDQDRQRAEIRQFVYSAQQPGETTP